MVTCTYLNVNVIVTQGLFDRHHRLRTTATWLLRIFAWRSSKTYQGSASHRRQIFVLSIEFAGKNDWEKSINGITMALFATLHFQTLLLWFRKLGRKIVSKSKKDEGINATWKYIFPKHALQNNEQRIRYTDKLSIIASWEKNWNDARKVSKSTCCRDNEDRAFIQTRQLVSAVPLGVFSTMTSTK